MRELCGCTKLEEHKICATARMETKYGLQGGEKQDIVVTLEPDAEIVILGADRNQLQQIWLSFVIIECQLLWIARANHFYP